MRDRDLRSDSNNSDKGLVRKRNHGKHNKRHQRSKSSEFDLSSDKSDDGLRKKGHRRHHKHQKRSHNVELRSSDYDYNIND